MSLFQLDSENADRDLTSQVTVLTHTPDANNPTQCQGIVCLGDGVKNLDGSGGDFELTVTVGGQTIQPDPQIVTFSAAVRAAAWTTVFPVPANAEVVLKVKSPNAADSDVDVTAYLFDVSPIVPGVVPGAVNDVGADSDDFDTNLTEATNDHYNGCVIVFTNGVLAGQSRRILDYDGTAKNIIVESAFTEAPGNGDKFMILGRIEV